MGRILFQGSFSTVLVIIHAIKKDINIYHLLQGQVAPIHLQTKICTTKIYQVSVNSGHRNTTCHYTLK